MNKELILVVDDNRELGDFIAYSLLPSLGYSTQIVYTGQAALDKARVLTPALMLLDLELPDMSGLDILRRLDAQGIQIPTILFTAHGSEAIAADAFRLGVYDYLIKPVEPEQLERAIQRSLTETRLRQETIRLTSELKEQVTWLKALLHIGQSLTATLELDDVLRHIVDAAVTLAQADEGFIALLDPASSQFYLRAARGLDDASTLALRLQVQDPQMVFAVQTGVPVRKSLEADRVPLKIKTGILVNSLLYVPIFSHGRALGVLAVDNRIKRSAFTRQDEILLTSLVGYAAVALENAGLYEHARREITERRRIEARLRHDAFTDDLTQLANRPHFLQRLNEAVQRQSGLFAVLFLDLDGFKYINDSLGHPAGDQLLIAVAAIIKDELRPEDTVARLGGDEFVMLLENIPYPEYAVQKTQAILARLATPVFLHKYNTYVTTSGSIGIVLSSLGYTVGEHILRDADIAMYDAKAHGKATYALFDPQMRERLLRRVRLESDLQSAIERRQLQLYYQPEVCLQTGQLIGFEARVQWQHPDYGLLSAADFVPLAQESGLMATIDWWVVGEACRQAMTWKTKFPSNPPSRKLAVNLTGSLVAHYDLFNNIKSILQQTGLDAGSLSLEIKESMIAGTSSNLAQQLQALRVLGVDIKLDNFGAGAASLLKLKSLSVDGLKIDQAYVRDLEAGGVHADIVGAIVQLAHRAGMKVVADGVETAGQCATLHALGCDSAQGFWFSPPVSAEAAATIIADCLDGAPCFVARCMTPL